MKQIQIKAPVFEKLDERSQQLGLTIEQYVDKIFREMDQAPPTVETVVVEAEITRGLYDNLKQFVETSDQAYGSISEFIEEAIRQHLLKKRTI